MSTLGFTRPFPRAARTFLALLLAVLGALGLSVPAQGATSYKVLYAFPQVTAGPPPEGMTPSGLLQGLDGNFYGTTYAGGATGQGSVFQLTPAGAVSVLYTFPAGGGEGANPWPAAGLIQDGSGNFYGTTTNGGAEDLGTIFQLTPPGTLTVLHTFTAAAAAGEHPYAGLVRDGDGTLYGTTAGGGGPGYGTVFKLAPTGETFTLTTLHLFSGVDGAYPAARLLRDGEGTLYGTTMGDGVANYGTVFKLTPTGPDFTFSTLHTFTGTDGAYPYGSLVRDAGGNLYGTTSGACTYGGGACSDNYGTVFKLTPTGPDFTLTTLHTFTGTDGANPYAGLLRDAAGNLYGATYAGGSSTLGTLFMLDPTNVLASTNPFTGANGANPYAGLTLGTDGYFYGTTAQGGGTGKSGVAFLLRVGNLLTLTPAGTGTGTVASAPLGISCPDACSEVFLPTATVTLTATPAASSTFTGWSGTGLTCPGTGTCPVPLTQAQTVTATFTLKTFALTIHLGGTGTGTVTSTPAGITCGTTCSHLFDYNTQVTLTAQPTGASVFAGWSGGGCSGTGTCQVTLTAAQTVTALFNPPTAPLTVTLAGSSPGSVTSSPAGITACSASCTVSFPTNTPITLTPAAGSGGTFTGWRGACTGSGTCQVTLSGAQTVTAVFAKTFTDATLTAGTTPVKAVHLTDLRAAIDALRSHTTPALPAFAWTDPSLTPGTTVVKRQHLLDLRTALDAAYAATPGKSHAAYTDPAITAGTTPIKASHLSELRSYVRGLE